MQTREQRHEVTLKCNFKNCRNEATKRLTLAVGANPIPAMLLVCEKHLFDMTDHGFKLSARLNEAGDVELWRPSW